MMKSRYFYNTPALLLTFTLAGCGGGGNEIEVVPVEGTITLDGDPLSGALVHFTPQDVTEGGPSYGSTDEDGHYELKYTDELDGAIPATHRISISTFADADEDLEGNEIPGSPELVPAEYNIESTLTREVTPDGGPYNFELKSGGVVIQSVEEDEGEDEGEDE